MGKELGVTGGTGKAKVLQTAKRGVRVLAPTFILTITDELIRRFLRV